MVLGSDGGLRVGRCLVSNRVHPIIPSMASRPMSVLAN